MTEVNKFVDRRTEDEKRNGLATQVLFWYDKDGKKRIRTNGIAVTADGYLVVARSTCSRKDQFVRAMGRMKVRNRMFGRAKEHFWILPVSLRLVVAAEIPDLAARLYSEVFAEDEIGIKRAYNIGKVFARSCSN